MSLPGLFVDSFPDALFPLEEFWARSKLSSGKTFFNVILLPQLSICGSGSDFSKQACGDPKKKQNNISEAWCTLLWKWADVFNLINGEPLASIFFALLCQRVFLFVLCWLYLLQFSGGKVRCFYWQTSKLVSFSSPEFDATKPGVQCK